MKKALLTGLAAIAAAGLGCASMHYSQRDTIEQEGNAFLYRDVARTPETLELAIRIMENGVIKEEAVWTRYEPANSAKCEKQALHVYVEGVEDFTIIDKDCNFEGSGMVPIGADEGTGYEQNFGDLNNEEFVQGRFTWSRQEVLNYLFYNVEYNVMSHFNEYQQLADYHRWKGLE